MIGLKTYGKMGKFRESITGLPFLELSLRELKLGKYDV